MTERVWRQLRQVGLSESTIITTGKSQLDILQNQLGMDLPIILNRKKRYIRRDCPVLCLFILKS